MRYECLKVFGNVKTLAVLALMFVINIVLSMQNQTVMFEGFNTDVYKYYMELLEGEYTDEKYDIVMEEYADMQEHMANESLYEGQYKDKLLSAEEYRELSSAASLAKSRIKTMEYIVSKTEYYAQCDEVPSYFYDIDVEDYIVNMSINIPLLISLILIIATLYNEDYAANTVSMIRSSRDGKERLFYRRIRLVLVIAVVFGSIFYMGEFLVKYFCMDLGAPDSNISSLMSMSESAFEGTVLEYILMSIGIRTVYTVIIALFISVIAIVTHKYIMTFAVSLGVVCLPAAVTDSAYVITKGLEVYPLFNSQSNAEGLRGVIVMLAVYAVLAILCVWGIYKKECK